MDIERRTDIETARAIQHAIAIDRTEGAVKAWRYLVFHGIAPNAIARVLGLNGDAPLRRATGQTMVPNPATAADTPGR